MRFFTENEKGRNFEGYAFEIRYKRGRRARQEIYCDFSPPFDWCFFLPPFSSVILKIKKRGHYTCMKRENCRRQ